MSYINGNFYIETSAVNLLAKQFSIKDAIATKALQSSKGNKWYLSTVTLWELLLTKDDTQRERMLAYCQFCFFECLLKSPSEICIDYFEQGCPAMSFYCDFHTQSPVGKIWTNINGDLAGTFSYDKQALSDWTQKLKEVSKKADKIINGIFLSAKLEREEEIIQALITMAYQNLPAGIRSPNVEQAQKLAILFIYYYMCVGIDFPQEPLRFFWQKYRISEPLDRLYFLLGKAPCMVQKGPFIEFANMAMHQIQLKKSTGRGLFHDSLHCIYLPFVDVFLTNDEHFISYKELGLREYHKKIIGIGKEGQLTGKLVRIEDRL